jgi:signal transduction histidine kinase
LFSSFVEKESRQDIERYRINPTLKEIYSKIEGLLRGANLDLSDIPDDARFPPATYMELEALFQNIFTNASNAMLDSPEKRIKTSLEIRGTSCVLRIEDTGSGVKLKDSEELFEPFIRYQKISLERRALGLGGTGLGLTIVRMIAERIKCSVHFIAPSKGFSTCFTVQWREQ